MLKPKLLFCLFLAGLALTGCRETNVNSASTDVAFLTVTPNLDFMLVGEEVSLLVTATYNNRSTEDVTDQATFSSSNSSLASFSATDTNLLTANSAGAVKVTARFSGVSKSLNLDLHKLTSIQVSKPSGKNYVLDLLQLSATGRFSGGSEDITDRVTWSVDDETIVKVSNLSGQEGAATPLSEGTAKVTASFGSHSGKANLTVSANDLSSLELWPVAMTLPNGLAQRVHALGVYSSNQSADLSKQVIWSASGSASVFYGQRGEVWVLASGTSGTATITATYGTVSQSMTVTLVSPTINSLVLTPYAPTLGPEAQTYQQAWAHVTAGGQNYLFDATQTATWATSNSAVANVSNINKGQTQGVAAGSASITATQGGVTGTNSITVSSSNFSALSLSPQRQELALGATARFRATLLHSSSKLQERNLASFWNSDGLLQEIAFETPGYLQRVLQGETLLQAKYNGISGNVYVLQGPVTLKKITIDPLLPEVPAGYIRQVNAIGTFSDGTQLDLTESVHWANDNTSIAQVSNLPGKKGQLRGIAAGTMSLKAYLDTTKGSTTVTVSSASLSSLEVSPDSLTLGSGHLTRYEVLGVFSDATTLDLTQQVQWTSSNTAAALHLPDEDDLGLFATIAAGSATLTAEVNGVSATTALTVNSATLSSLSIESSGTQAQLDSPFALTATALLSDGQTLDVTKDAIWSSNDESLALIANDKLSSGVMTAIQSGTVTIKAKYQGITASKRITLSP